MKISLDSNLKKASNRRRVKFSDSPPYLFDVKDVSELALLTATAVANQVRGRLAYRKLEKYIEVLRFRFLEEDADGGTLVEITPVISRFGERKDQPLPASSRIPHEDNGKVSDSVVHALAGQVEAFIYKQLKEVVLRHGGEFDALRRFLL